MRKLTLLALAALAVGVAVAPAQAGTDGHAAKVGARVKVVNYDFIRKRVKIRRGRRVVWKNRQGTHTVTFRKRRRGGKRRARRFDEVLSEGERTSRRFRRPGRYPYICRFHVQLGHKGVVVVK